MEKTLDVSFALTYGIQTNQVKKIFDDFTNLENVIDIKKLGQGATGFVRKLLFHKTIKNKTYTTFAALKLIKVDVLTDSEYYEYLVGLVVNYFAVLFPFFIKTYGVFRFKDVAAYNSLIKMTIPSNTLNSWLYQNLILIHGITLNSISQEDLSYSCLHHTMIALLSEFANNSSSLDSQLDDKFFIKYDLFPIIYLLYNTLHILKDRFTHYDLHTDNVLLVQSTYPNRMFRYNVFHYDEHGKLSHIDLIYSRFIPKIIDYSRAFFRLNNLSSLDVYKKLCHIQQDCCSRSGYGWMRPTGDDAKSFIDSTTRNVSHDLKLITIIVNQLISSNLANDEIKSIYDKLVFPDSYGIPENLSSYSNTGKINNVSDMAEFSDLLYRNNHDSCFPNFPSEYTVEGTYDIHLITNQTQEMSYIVRDFSGVDDLPVS
jgi:hypothetical protein